VKSLVDDEKKAGYLSCVIYYTTSYWKSTMPDMMTTFPVVLTPQYEKIDNKRTRMFLGLRQYPHKKATMKATSYVPTPKARIVLIKSLIASCNDMLASTTSVGPKESNNRANRFLDVRCCLPRTRDVTSLVLIRVTSCACRSAVQGLELGTLLRNANVVRSSGVTCS
jgi:hypothetical protein